MAKQERQTGWQERNRSGTGCEEKKPVPCFGFKLHLIVGATCEPPCFLPCNQSLCSRKRMDPAYGMKPVMDIRRLWKDEKERPLPEHQNINDNERGEVFL